MPSPLVTPAPRPRGRGRLAAPAVALAALLLACAPPPMPEVRVVAAADQGTFAAGSPFRLAATTPGVTDPKALKGVSFEWAVEGPCDAELSVDDDRRGATLQVARSCGPRPIKVRVVARRGDQKSDAAQDFVPEPIANLFGVEPVRPDPRPAGWVVLDDFSSSPTSKRTTLGTRLGVWNFDDAKCRFEPADEKGAVLFSGDLPRASAACGLYLPLAEDAEGKPSAGDVGAYRALTLVVRARAREVPFVVEITEFDKFAAYNQGATIRSGVLIASPDGWRRHEIPLAPLLRGLAPDKVRQIGLAFLRQGKKNAEFAVELDELAWIER